MLMDFKVRMLAIPQKVAPLVISEDDTNKIVDILEKEVFGALEELSEYDPMKVDKERETALFEEEDDEDE